MYTTHMNDDDLTYDPDCDCADCLFEQYADATDTYVAVIRHPLPTYAAANACGCNACQAELDTFWGDIYCNG
jgi:hypothetical protein